MKKRHSNSMWKGVMFAMLWTISLGVFAQNITVKGNVKDDTGMDVIGATIIVEGNATVGTTTDMDGNYVLKNVPSKANLVFSYVGLKTQTVAVNGRTTINVKMAADTELLDEVVVVGFGTQKKVNLTGSVSQVKMDDVLGDRPVTGLGAALQGAVPGFTASSSVIPGEGNTFNVRGLGSINGGGGSPLILVDNVVYNDLYLINPADIESISVLKDASSAAIYGARASFGVILITTKKGKKNETLSINYNNNFALSTVNNLPQLSTPMEMIQTLKDGGYSSIWSGQNIDTYMDVLQKYAADPTQYPKGWTEVNGTKYFMKQNNVMTGVLEQAWKTTHNISAQGGSEKIQYRMSLGLVNEDGVLITKKDNFKRTNVSAFVSGDITPWLNTSIDVKYNYGKKRHPYLGSGGELGLYSTILPSYHPVGLLPYGSGDDAIEYYTMAPEDIVKLTNASQRVDDNTRILSRTVIKPFKGLEGVLEYSYQISSRDYEAYANKFFVHQGIAESIKPSTSTTPFTTSRESTRYTTINAFLSYNEIFDNAHNISAVLGYNQEYNDWRYLFSEAYNMISNEQPSLSGTDGSTPPKTTDNYDQYALRSGFMRLNYNYKQRYFVEFNGRMDMSSKFPKAYRRGYFPSVSAAWNIINEPFMESVHNVLSQLKLRGSYGTLGNQNVDNYGFLATLAIANADWLNGGVIPKTLNAPGMVRANYTWEKVKTINGGIDFGFINNRLTGSFDIYKRFTIGMLGPSEEFPAVAGASAPTQNAADMETNGWELQLNWKDQIGKVNYGLGFNIYDSRSYIQRYKNETKLLSSYYVGQEVGEIWGYVTDGFYTAADFNENGTLKDGVVTINGVTSHEGDIKYKNLRDDENSTNRIDSGDDTATNPGDRKIIGNSRPRLQFGLNGFAEWNNFTFSFMLQGTAKRDSWIGGNMIFPMSSQYGTVYQDQVGKIWTPDNKENAYYGRIYENAGSSQGANQRVSDKFLSNASYLRIKNLTLGYNLPKSLVSKIYLQGVKLFVSGENLFTFDKLPSGIDPETLGWGYPHYSTISFGLNLNL